MIARLRPMSAAQVGITNMTTRTLLIAAALAAILAACGGTAAGTPEPTAGPATPVPTASESPAPTAGADDEVDGTITYVGGAAVDGPGRSIADALTAQLDGPDLVNGVLLMDPDGAIWLCDTLVGTDPLECEGGRLAVVDYPDIPELWDMANADLTGLQEADGIRFHEAHQVYGIVAP